jgi:hypothetical protein
MAYIKLDKSIITSSVWVDPDTRMVFIAALIMAEPYELTEPTPQLNIDDLNETGFIVPPGLYGMLPASGPRFIEIVKLPLERGMKALAMLGSPDPESRSQEYEGRRMVRVSGGYLILNYFRFWKKDHSSTERVRKFRERKAQAQQEQSERRQSRARLRRVNSRVLDGMQFPP